MASTEARPGHSTTTSQHKPALAPVCGAAQVHRPLHYTITIVILVPSHCRFHQVYLVLLVRTKLTPERAVSSAVHLQHCSKGKGRSGWRQCTQCCTWGLHSTLLTVPCSNPRNLALYPRLLLSTGASSTGQQRYLSTENMFIRIH